MKFQEYIAVDWSGAKGSNLKGLQVAMCKQGRSVPHLVLPPDQRAWTRQQVWDYVLTRGARRRVFAVFDMGIGLTYADEQTYFPGLLRAPNTIRRLWKAIDEAACDATDFYGGPAASPPSPYAPYFNVPGHHGARFTMVRHRTTETYCRAWTRPSSVFNGVGAGSVGMGSLAGMRLMHYIKKTKPDVAIWPFDAIDNARIVVAEMFPRLYVKQAGLNPQHWREPDFLPRVLRYFACRGPFPAAPTTEDEMDALYSAAAIRFHAHNPAMWSPQGMNATAKKYEGWIFGVP
jgi:hypothetical protein